MKVADRRRHDPRLGMSGEDLLDARSYQSLPLVARERRATDGLGFAVGIVGALGLGALTFVSLASHRTAPAPRATAFERVQTPIIQAPIAEAPAPALAANIPEPPEENAAPEGTPSQVMPMVLDNTATTQSATTAAHAEGAADDNAREHRAEAFTLNAGSQDGTARSVRPGDLRTTVVQGTIIPAVLETAVNTDIPGGARAIVSRDVRSFDGASVLIPRGSRLVGQYRGATPGQSRAFIGWSRLIRPDGVSIDLASPAVDTSGAAGIAGRVDRHTFQNFGSAVLYSVVGALPALANATSPTIVIGANSVAQSAAGQMAQSDARAPPTIRVPVGAPIQVFTTQDLTFD